MATGFVYDQLTAAATLEDAAEMIGYDAFRARQAELRAEGRLVGIGISLLAEPSAITFGWFSTDAAIVRIGLRGAVLHDRDASFTAAFDAVFQAAGVRIVRSAVQAPRMNSVMERWIGSCRREPWTGP